MIDFGALQAQAAADGRRGVVGALVLDPRGRAFVHRRGWDRRFLPGCWDIVGGHVEAGESLLAALARELAEETGWYLRGTPQLVHIVDWDDRREFDFLVDVEGDLARPRLESPKHVEFRWIGPQETELLDENRGEDGGLVRRLVELALRSSRPRELTYPHASVFLDAAIVAPIETVRARWDPAMWAQIPAHVTVTYPSEVRDIEDLRARLARASGEVAPFRLTLGRVDRESDGGPVFVEVDDPDHGWSTLRRLVVGDAPARPRPHVTLVHPRTTNRGVAAWETLGGHDFSTEIRADEVSLSAFDGRTWPVVDRFVLRA